jgi:hypothetical protein
MSGPRSTANLVRHARESSTTTPAAPWSCRWPLRRSAAKQAAPTPDESHDALADYVAYFGTYSVDERAGTVTHRRHASVQPGDVGDLVRGYAFVGDRLILRPPGTTYEVIWERIT